VASPKIPPRVDAPTISILPHALWPLLTLATVALWMAAMADITRHRRRGTFTRAGLVCMAAAVSAVAVMVLAGTGAVFAGQRFEVVSRADSDGVESDERGGEGVPGHTYVFSFGLEHASDVTPARPKSTNQ
jgi:hypothetical protein